MDIKIKNLCSRCLGKGIDENLIPPTLCVSCTGTGYVGRDIIDTTDIMEQLGYIHGKVTAIWNKVKDL